MFLAEQKIFTIPYNSEYTVAEFHSAASEIQFSADVSEEDTFKEDIVKGNISVENIFHKRIFLT